MGALFGRLVAGVGTTAAYALLIGMIPGWIYWLWMAVHLGSFLMLVIGLAGPLAALASLIGLWSLVFGAPLWLVHLFA